MKVFKFGGASVSSLDRIKNVASIISEYNHEPLVVVISAMGKTTNALEKVVEAFFNGETEKALSLFESVKRTHTDLAKYLLVKEYNPANNKLVNYFTEVEWLLHDRPVQGFDYYYDQVVCIGELLSTTIIHAYLAEEGIRNTYIDIRDVFRTDDNFRDAAIDWEFTTKRVRELIVPECQRGNVVITQGFIASTDENESTTLGREGSDYSAAILANILEAEGLTIWKDVEGVLNADPKNFPEAVVIPELNYEEVIEMAYYGAQVIHPKTMKPLQNKNIPLRVKSFVNRSLPGTIIHHRAPKNLPPVIVIKEDQVLIKLVSLDLSFVGEQPMADLYSLLSEIRIKPNLVQTGAVSIFLCLDNREEKIQQLALETSLNFDVQVEKNLTLLTIRHFTEEVLENMTQNKSVEIRQQSRETVQLLIR